MQPSYSGPIVWGERVFTTETVDERTERVVAVDRQTGETLWTQQWDGAMKVPFFAASRGSWIRATPACDGQRVYVGGMRDVLSALDVQTGKIIWQVNFVEKLQSPLPSFGFVSSPLIDGDALYVQAGGGVVKLDKQTGEIQWRALADGGGMYGSAFSSPVIEYAGRDASTDCAVARKAGRYRAGHGPGVVDAGRAGVPRDEYLDAHGGG